MELSVVRKGKFNNKFQSLLVKFDKDQRNFYVNNKNCTWMPNRNEILDIIEILVRLEPLKSKGKLLKNIIERVGDVEFDIINP